MLKTINPLLNADALHALAAQCKVVVGATDKTPDVRREVRAVIDTHETKSFKFVTVERFAFYSTASSAFAIIASGERRLYGCFVMTKGVIAPQA